MGQTLTPAQKALSKAKNIRAELDCGELQTVKKEQGVVNARTRAHVNRTLRTERISDKIDEKLAMATALLGLTEKQRVLLSGPEKETPTPKSGAPHHAPRGKNNGAADSTIQ